MNIICVSGNLKDNPKIAEKNVTFTIEVLKKTKHYSGAIQEIKTPINVLCIGYNMDTAKILQQNDSVEIVGELQFGNKAHYIYCEKIAVTKKANENVGF
jgi:hypothetical protein